MILYGILDIKNSIEKIEPYMVNKDKQLPFCLEAQAKLL